MADVVAVITLAGNEPIYHDNTPKLRFQARVVYLGDGIREEDGLETYGVDLTASVDIHQILADEAKSLAQVGYGHTVDIAIVDGHKKVPS